MHGMLRESVGGLIDRVETLEAKHTRTSRLALLAINLLLLAVVFVFYRELLLAVIWFFQHLRGALPDGA